ncbi:uncharacterized protein LOC120188106 [Hibiscus syriacus]|uniref:uncharacterized protein LOC120188106 n=1 Tax=Hibiscus syriacus TaxID=106335 RepID=UPI0019245904|nr:uncharacterized protein LOC120188106 [Hibiscus syriacus]
MDNTLLAQDIVKGYGRNSISPRCAIKIDLQKAFDSLGWDSFLPFSKLLICLLFFIHGLKLVTMELNTQSHSMLLNLVAARGVFGYHPKCKKVGLTHLTFSDDLLIFCKGNIESIVGVISVLHKFHEISGLQLNVAKSEIFAAGISPRNLEIIKNFTGFKIGLLPVRYLGVPLVSRKLSVKDFLP